MRSIAGIERELASRADQRVLRWFGHVERMDEYLWPEGYRWRDRVSGWRVRGRPRLGWMDGVKVALGNRGTTVEAALQCAKDRKEWRALVKSSMASILPVENLVYHRMWGQLSTTCSNLLK